MNPAIVDGQKLFIYPQHFHCHPSIRMSSFQMDLSHRYAHSRHFVWLESSQLLIYVLFK